MNAMNSTTQSLGSDLRLPVIVAPMFLISSPELVIAAGKAGLLGVYAVANSRTIGDLEIHLAKIDAELRTAGRVGQWAINMIVHPTYDRFDAEMDLIARYKPKMIVTALGGPKRALERVHGFGGKVFCDVTQLVHARKAVDAGADGLVLVASGAGGHTGSYSPFAFVEEVRRFWDGPIIIGGAISNARSIRAALTLGADFAYMGTRFIVARESMVSDDYREMLVRATLLDIVSTKAVTGVLANWMRESLERANFDIANLDVPGKIDFSDIASDSKAWKNIWGAGQGAGSVTKIQSAQEIVDELAAEYESLTPLTRVLDQWPHQNHR
jgi:nitronate monooxygenase